MKQQLEYLNLQRAYITFLTCHVIYLSLTSIYSSLTHVIFLNSILPFIHSQCKTLHRWNHRTINRFIRINGSGATESRTATIEFEENSGYGTNYSHRSNTHGNCCRYVQKIRLTTNTGHA